MNALRAAQLAYENAYPYDDARELALEEAEQAIRTDEAAMRECVEEAAGTDTAGVHLDALMALHDAQACGLFPQLENRRPLNAIQAEALSKLAREARHWYALVDAEVEREAARKVAA